MFARSNLKFFDLFCLANIVTGFGISVIVAGIIKFVVIIWKYIKTAKIAVCPLKQEK
jgi:hypothetical protein